MRNHLHRDMIVAIDEANLYPLLQRNVVQCARSFIGIVESGHNDGPEVRLVQLTVDNRADRESYCMSFVQTIIGYTEYRMTVKSRMFASERVMTVWDNTPKEYRSDVPVLGSVAMWNWKGTGSGHCGIVTRIIDTGFMSVEGNTNSGSTGFSKGNEGQGFFEKSRPLGNVGDMILLGFILPFIEYRASS